MATKPRKRVKKLKAKKGIAAELDALPEKIAADLDALNPSIVRSAPETRP